MKKNSQVRSVTFEPKYKLRAIIEEAFSRSNLASIQIPSHVTQICLLFFFSNYEQLERVDFEPNSEQRTIEPKASFHSAFANAVELKDGWCHGSNNLSHIDV